MASIWASAAVPFTILPFLIAFIVVREVVLRQPKDLDYNVSGDDSAIDESELVKDIFDTLPDDSMKWMRKCKIIPKNKRKKNASTDKGGLPLSNDRDAQHTDSKEMIRAKDVVHSRLVTLTFQIGQNGNVSGFLANHEDSPFHLSLSIDRDGFIEGSMTQVAGENGILVKVASNDGVTVEEGLEAKQNKDGPITRLLPELNLVLFNKLTPVDSACFGLTCKVFYRIHREKHGTVSLEDHNQRGRALYDLVWGERLFRDAKFYNVHLEKFLSQVRHLELWLDDKLERRAHMQVGEFACKEVDIFKADDEIARIKENIAELRAGGYK